MELNKEERVIRDALSQIETPACDMERAVMGAMAAKAPVRRHSLPRAALLAAALVAILAIGAAAVGISGLWERFFVNPIPQNAITTIGVSQTSGEYTLTLEDAMVDDTAILLLMSLRRADGRPIDPEAHLRTNFMGVEMLADGETFMGGGGFGDEFLSENGTTRYFSYAIENFDTKELKSLSEKSLTFTAQGVAVQVRMPDGFYHYLPGETVDLSPLAQKEIADLSGMGEHWARESKTSDPQISAALEAMNLSLPLPLEKDFPQYKVRGAVITPDGPGVALTQAQGRSGDRACTRVDAEALIDTRDGTRYEQHRGHQVELADGSKIFLTTFSNCPLTAADLPYLRLEVSYAIDRILSEEPFSLTFTPNSGTSVTVPLDSAMTVEDTRLHLTKLRFSALGLTLTMDGLDSDRYRYPFENDGTGPVVTLKDGSVIQTYRWGGSDPGEASFTTDFRYYHVGDDRAFLDTDQIASITLNGITIWSTGEYSLSLKDVMADDDGAVVLLALTRVDGGPVNPEAHIQGNTVSASLLVDGDALGILYPRGRSLSEDGKTLYFCYELRSMGNTEGSALDGKALTVKTGGVVVPMTASEAFPGRNMTGDLSQPLPLSEEFPSFRLVSVEMTDRGPAVTVSQGRDTCGDYACVRATPSLLIDSRDGTEYSITESEYITLDDGATATRSYFSSKHPLTKADVPYLQIHYGYALDRVLSSAPVSLTFTPSRGTGQIVPMDQTVTVDGISLHLTELRFSALGLSLRLSNKFEDSYVLYQDGISPVVHLKDGSAIATHGQGGSGGADHASVSFQPQDKGGERVFLDTDQIASISLGDTTIWSAD